MASIEEEFDSLREQKDVLWRTCRTVATHCCQCANTDGHQFEHLTLFFCFAPCQISYVNRCRILSSYFLILLFFLIVQIGQVIFAAPYITKLRSLVNYY